MTNKPRLRKLASEAVAALIARTILWFASAVGVWTAFWLLGRPW